MTQLATSYFTQRENWIRSGLILICILFLGSSPSRVQSSLAQQLVSEDRYTVCKGVWGKMWSPDQLSGATTL